MNRAITKMTMALLEDFLCLPKGCHIYAILRTPEDHRDGMISLYLQGEGMPEIDPSEPTPHIKLIHEKVNGVGKLRGIEEC